MEKKHYIYMIKNIVNNKIYVGCTKNFEQRKKTHLSHMRCKKHCNEYLIKDFEIFGETSFYFHVIEECESEKKEERERYWIQFYDSNNLEIGYNLESGGNKGKKRNKEVVDKIHSIMKQRGYMDGKHPNSKKVIRLNDGFIFDSLSLAARDIGVIVTNLSKVCNNVRPYITGKDNVKYQFAYYEEGKEYKLKEIEKKIHTNSKKVICLSNMKTYNSLADAASDLGLCRFKVSAVCNGKRKTTGGLKFIFKDEHLSN